MGDHCLRIGFKLTFEVKGHYLCLDRICIHEASESVNSFLLRTGIPSLFISRLLKTIVP